MLLVHFVTMEVPCGPVCMIPPIWEGLRGRVSPLLLGCCCTRDSLLRQNSQWGCLGV